MIPVNILDIYPDSTYTYATSGLQSSHLCLEKEIPEAFPLSLRFLYWELLSRSRFIIKLSHLPDALRQITP